MTARLKELEDLNRLRQFLVCTDMPERARWLTAALSDQGVTVWVGRDVTAVPQALATTRPQVVFIDFLMPENGEQDATPARAIDVAREFIRHAPEIPLVGVGSTTQAAGTLAALRVGVRDFVDLSSSDDEVVEIVDRILAAAAFSGATPAVSAGRQGKMVALLGARIGVGTSTLAAHLATLARANKNEGVTKGGAERNGNSEAAPRVALIDLGLPVGDGLLYLNATGSFDFAEAVRNVARFDETLVRTALAPSPYDVPVLSLPRDLAEMRMITHGDSLALLAQLRRYFDLLVVDLGGFPNLDLVTDIVRAADETWLIADQSISAVVSLADLLQELDQRKVSRATMRLIVNRYDERYGMSAAQLAERFELPLAGTLPDRTLSLMRHANLGKLLVTAAERDSYVRAVRILVDALGETGPPAIARRRWRPWNEWLARR